MFASTKKTRQKNSLLNCEEKRFKIYFDFRNGYMMVCYKTLYYKRGSYDNSFSVNLLVKQAPF